MKRVFLLCSLIFVFLLLPFPALAGTVLTPGDLMFVSINGDADVTYDKGFSFLTLVNLEAGTEIYFTDYGWSDTTDDFITNTGISDRFIKYTVPAGGINAGTIIRSSTNSTTGFTFDFTYSPVGNYNYLSIVGVSNSDEVLVFQDSRFHPEFICAATYYPAGWATNVGPNGMDNLSGVGSALPPGLIDDLTALSFNQLSTANDNSSYSGPTTAATKAEWQARIANYANWTFNDAIPIPTPLSGPFTVTGINSPPAFVGGTTAFTISQNASATDIKDLLHASDTDSGQTLTWSQYTAPGHGTLSFSGATASSGSSNIVPGGIITYTPSAGHSGTDSFVVQVSDGTEVATRTINVSIIANVPSASVSGIAAPVAGTAPAAYSSLVPGNASYTVTNLGWQNADGTSASLVNGKFKAGSTYKAVIELTAAAGYKFPAGGLTPSVNTGSSSLGSVSGGDVEGNRLTFSVSFDATAPLAATGIAITSQPVLSYIEGQALNLTGLEVTLTYNDTSTEQNIGPVQFSAKSITANPANGTILSVTHNAQTIEISCNGHTAQTSALAVVAATYTISASTDSLAFGNAIHGYGSAPAAQTVTITNTGNSPVTLNTPTNANYDITALDALALAPAATARFEVRPKTGLAVGAYNATITFNTTIGTEDDVTTSFTVNTATYTVSASPGSLAFGSVIVGYGSAPAAQTVTITNTGNSSVTLNTPTNANYDITALDALTLAPAATARFEVRPKTGLAAGTHNATITFSTTIGSEDDVTVSFAVNTATYTVSASPGSLAFGSVIEGYGSAPAAQTVTITNTGNSPVTLITPTNANYVITALDSLTLAPAATAQFSVQPKGGLSVGAYNETITFSTLSSTSDSVTVSFAVQSANYAIEASTDSLAFASVIEGYVTAPAAQTVTITNKGNKNVTLLTPTSTAYDISTIDSLTIAPDGAAQFSVQPKTALGVGNHNETIVFNTTSSTSDSITVSFAVQSASHTVEADVLSLSFASAIEGYATAPAAQTVTIINTGNSPVTLITPTSTAYDISTSDSLTIAPDGIAQFSVHPKTALGVGNHNETIVFNTTSSTSDSITVSFAVQSASHTVEADVLSLSFASVIEGYGSAPAAQTVTITNKGNKNVTLITPTSTAYDISTSDSLTIAPDGAAQFSVQPKTALGVGNHNETIVFSTTSSTSDSITVFFTVQSANYAIETSTDSLAFASVIEGYATAPAAQTVTITNKGNKNVTLITPTSTDYDISTTDSLTIAPDGAAQFSVRPKTALGAGNHNETIVFSTTSSTSDSITVSFTVQSASYAISVTPLLRTFTSAAEGTAPPAEETFTITNIGNMAVTLTQPTATDYIIGALSPLSIDPLETATFTVAPKAGLAEGSYTETITIPGSNGASAQAEVRFTVTEALAYAIGADPASITFDSLAEGYLPPDAKMVTVTNTGNQSISLYQPTSSRYTIGTLSGTALIPGGTATFTVVPMEGLAAGAWNETIHILGSYGVNAQVNVSFTCTEPLDYFIISGDGSTYQQDDTDSLDITVTANGDISNFTGLTINGELVDESNYDVMEGSTIIVLHQDFLDTLIPGTYTLTFHYTDGQAQAEFVVHDRMPVTGDNEAMAVYGALIALSILALLIIRRKHAIR